MRRCAVAPSVSTVRSGGRTSRHGAAAQATRTDSRSIAVRSTTTSTRAVSVSPKSTILGWRVAVAAMPSPGALGVEPSEAARSSTKIPTRPAASMPTSGIAQRHDDAAHVRETLLPDRVLDHDRHEVPTMLDGGQPQLTGRRRDEVREEEDERARRHRARVLGEVRDRALEPVGGAAVLGRPQALVAQLDELPLAFRLPPVG